MGQLVEQPIPSLFNGVSRQPHRVRLGSQVQDADDALLSVVTGGFEKRPASVAIAKLDVDTSLAQKFHAAARSGNELILINIDENGDVRIYDLLNGTPRTVNTYDTSVRAYLAAGNMGDFVMMTNDAYTILLNRSLEVSLKPVDSSRYKGEKEEFSQLPGVRGYPKTDDIWRVNHGGEQADDEYYQWDGTEWVLKWTGSNFPTNTTVIGESREIADLPPAMDPDPVDGDVWKVGEADDDSGTYYTRWNAYLNIWEEASNPFQQNELDPATMPHAIRLETDGSFTVGPIEWSPRMVGDDDLTPHPKFVYRNIQDVFFHKARFGILAGDWVTLSQQKSYFNFYPASATQSVDTDPIDRPANFNKAVTLRYAVPFRKSLFITSDEAQFELSSDSYLTPKDAALDLATAYTSSSLCRPVALGDELYFTATTQNRAAIFEYYYNDSTISNTAADVTKHVADFVVPDLVKMTGDPVSGTLWAYSSGRPEGLYVYTAYWSEDQKLQSAWAFWNLGCDEILEAEFIGSYLYLVVRRDQDVFIERISPVREAPVGGLTFNPLLNCRHVATGTFDTNTGRTTFVLPFKHMNRAAIVLSGDFHTKAGKWMDVSYEADPYTVSVPGDVSGGLVYAGLSYRMNVELSRQYVRDDQGTAVINGRLQLRNMTLSYASTAFFEVHKTPEARPTKVYKMTGRKLGSSSNQLNQIPISDGTFRFPVNSRGDTVRIAVVNDTPFPSAITAASWVGFFNEVSRQDR